MTENVETRCLIVNIMSLEIPDARRDIKIKYRAAILTARVFIFYARMYVFIERTIFYI